MKTRSDLTFKHNIKQGRHGWLRLTPAYSIKIVHEIIAAHPSLRYILDPFSGTGTTGLVCAELGLTCDLLDINPFLIWFAKAKTANYTPAQRQAAQQGAGEILLQLKTGGNDEELWFPPIKNIERWWTESRLVLLSQLHQAIEKRFPEESPAKNLLLVAFSRLVIEWSNAAFNHQSMSFKSQTPALFDNVERDELLAHFAHMVEKITDSTMAPLTGRTRVRQEDSRVVSRPQGVLYDGVITSPPYPNRMSYIRELRPYMYWLGYLREAREAGELDWQAIGGTWGIATSRVEKWQPNGSRIKHDGFAEMIEAIGVQSKVLANYVHKYFVDAAQHLRSVYEALAPNGKVFYVIGNSKFYDTLVPVEGIYASLLRECGFSRINVTVLRKRNSKKELKEMLITAVKL
jgi:DNA modification methylase